MRLWVLIAGLAALAFVPRTADMLFSPVDEKDILRAFMESVEIKQAQKEYRGWTRAPEGPRILLSNGQCGVAGCGYSSLVAQEFTSTGPNTGVRHILGWVHVSPHGEIESVERVMLVPYKSPPGGGPD